MYDVLSTLFTVAFGGGMYFVGKKVGRHSGSRDTRRELQNPEPVCGCTHNYAVHDESGCHAETTERVLVERGDPTTVLDGYAGSYSKTVYNHEKWETVTHSCPCKRYTGPEPMPLYLP